MLACLSKLSSVYPLCHQQRRNDAEHLAAGTEVESAYRESKSRVLPLNYPATSAAQDYTANALIFFPVNLPNLPRRISKCSSHNQQPRYRR